MKQLQKTQKGRMMIGQAGVFRVASMLLLRGHIPMLPPVDAGIDIMLDNGLRIQVKSRNLTTHPAYPDGIYCFSLNENNQSRYGNQKKRDWTKVVDFIIFWGIGEDRYFIIPSSEAKRALYVRPRITPRCYEVAKSSARIAAYEDRWDYLDINKVFAEIESHNSVKC